jgi:hypothetical protein
MAAKKAVTSVRSIELILGIDLSQVGDEVFASYLETIAHEEADLKTQKAQLADQIVAINQNSPAARRGYKAAQKWIQEAEQRLEILHRKVTDIEIEQKTREILRGTLSRQYGGLTLGRLYSIRDELERIVHGAEKDLSISKAKSRGTTGSQ